MSQSGAVLRYVIQAKNARGKALALLLDQALCAPDLFVFGELLELASVKALAGTPDSGVLDLLNVFAYGTFNDYVANAATLPPLKPEQEKKLRLLTIVSLAHSKKTIPYAELLAAVHTDTLRELEDLVIEAIYSELISGKLDQRRQQLTIDCAIGRDIQEGDLHHMISLFDQWTDNCERLLKNMDKEITKANAAKAEEDAEEKNINERIETIKADLKKEEKDPKSKHPEGFSSMEYSAMNM